MGDIYREENERHDDEEEGDGEGGGRQMLGFMFGNVDDAGDLDEEYLDQDAKEHLSALADQLGPSLVDIEQLSAKRKKLTLSTGEEHDDYGHKAEDAVDYEDIQEQYEGPEVQLGPQDLQFYAQAALAGPPKLPEEDNYDEEEDFDTSEQPTETRAEPPVETVQDLEVPVAGQAPGLGGVHSLSSDEEVEEKEDLEQVAAPQTTTTAKLQEEDAAKIELPVLCQEDGKTVLRFSELFGVREPYWVVGQRKGRQRRGSMKEKRDRVEEDEEAMEDDEEAVLKSCSQMPILVADSGSVESDTESESSSDQTEEGSGREEGMKTITLISRNQKGRGKVKKALFVPAEPMKQDSDLWVPDIADWKRQIPLSNFDLIHQDEWESNILWDKVTRGNAKSVHRSGGKLSVEVESESEHSHMFGIENGRASCSEGNEEDLRAVSEWHRPFLIEPLCRPSTSGENHEEVSRVYRHPQMLRLETHSFMKAEGQESIEILNRTSNLTLDAKEKNLELASGGWLDRVLWEESESGPPRSQIIFDLNDQQMVFEISDTKEGHAACLHAAAVVLTPQGKEGASDGGEGIISTTVSFTRFNISNDKYYTNKKTHQQQKSHAKKRAIHGIKVMHSLPAAKLQSMKPKLSNKDLANFHRPKAVWYPHHNEVAAKEQGKLAAKGPMKVILKTLGGKGSKLNVDASETLDVLKTKAAKKLGDLKASEKTTVLYSGKDLVEGLTFAQQQVPPNSVLHLVRTKVHPWPKAQRLPGENKPIRPPGAFKKKSELSVKDGHVALMEYCEERPLLLGNVGMGARLSTYYRKLTPTDATAATLRAQRGTWVGVTLPLEPTEDSPFLGDIRPGETQSSLETNMYRAPVFAHKVATTDFLLVRSAKGKLSLRRIDSIHVVGQQEPHMEVLTPTSKTVQNYIGNRLLVYLYREFRSNEKPGQLPPRVPADELLSQFPLLTEGFMRKRLKHCADLQCCHPKLILTASEECYVKLFKLLTNTYFYERLGQRVGGEMCWVMRRNFRIPSEEELRRLVTPENVCTYESMQAGQHHLKRMGVQKLTQPSGLAAAMCQLPDEAITLAAASHIERELQITPWNLSSNFVAATMQGRGSLERLEIVGPGDPSGRGLGFSYLRVATKPPNAGALVEKKAAAARGGGAVTGTDADLRRLSMEAAREVLLKFKVPEEVINKLTRWHRIAMVRKLSSEQAASGVKLGAAALNKFARGQRMSFLQLQQQTREKCQDIWDRQAQSLSVAEGDDTDSDGEANGDLDSFAGDLENLLEAEEGDEGGGKKGKREGMGGLGARRRKLLAQMEDDIEDEEAEAAELRRMLMEDDEAEEEQKKKKSGTVSKDKKDSQSTEAPADAGGQALAGKKKKQILKRIIRTRKPDGSYTSKEIIITDPKEVASYLAKKNAMKGAGQKAGADKEVSAKKGTGKSPLIGKKLKKGTPVKEVKPSKISAKGKVNGKFGRDALSLVCGACGQLGHMRTNKKCPLYMEEGEPVAWQDSGAGAEGLLERQGTKILIKRKPTPAKKMEEIESPKPPQAPTLKAVSKKEPKPTPAKLPKPTPAKLPSIKIRLPSGNSQVTYFSERPGKMRTIDLNLAEDSVGSQFVKPPRLKLKLASQKRKGMELAKVKKDQEVETEEEKEREQLRKDQEAYEAALQEERERETRELERRAALSSANGAENSWANKVRRVVLISSKKKKKKSMKMKEEDSDVLRKREREREEQERENRARQVEAEEYQKALAEELRLEEEELERKHIEEERSERERLEKEEKERREHEKFERDRLRQQMKEKERRREREQIREQERIREAQREVQEREEREEQSREVERRRQERERLHEKQVKLKRVKDRERVMSLSLPPEKDKGKGVKRRPEVAAPMYNAPDFSHPPKRMRKRGGEVDLCNILEVVVETLKNSDCAYLFQKPVHKKEAPDYLHYVKRPMDLSTIRERVRKLKYKNRGDFRQDVQQIADNAHIYNDGRNPQIPPLADRLLEICDDELEARDAELEEAESAVEPLEDDPRRNSPRPDRRRGVRMC